MIAYLLELYIIEELGVKCYHGRLHACWSCSPGSHSRQAIEPLPGIASETVVVQLTPKALTEKRTIPEDKPPA